MSVRLVRLCLHCATSSGQLMSAANITHPYIGIVMQSQLWDKTRDRNDKSTILCDEALGSVLILPYDITSNFKIK